MICTHLLLFLLLQIQTSFFLSPGIFCMHLLPFLLLSCSCRFKQALKLNSLYILPLLPFLSCRYKNRP